MNTEIETIIAAGTADDKVWGPTLKAFIEKASGSYNFPELLQGSKRKDFWKALLHIAKHSQDPCVIRDCFVVMRLLSREKQCLAELINEEWRDLIKKHSGLCDPNFEFSEQKTPICIEVQKSLSNIMFNSRGLAEDFRTNGILTGLQRRIRDYENEKIPDEVRFFDMKLFFLITALSSDARSDMKSMFDLLVNLLVEELREAADNHFEHEDLPPLYLMDTQVDLVNEILKALFNITVGTDESDAEVLVSCYSLVEVLRSYLLICSNNLEKTWALRNNVINLLTNMPDETYKALLLPVHEGHRVPNNLVFEDYNMTAIYEILMFLKAKFNDQLKINNQHEILSPVVTVLLKGASGHRVIRKFLRNHILPPLTDVHTRPEEGSTLRNHLCRLLTTPIMELRDLDAELLFVLCKKSVSRMIKYTGYGNAAGLFAQRGLLGGGHIKGEDDFSSESENSETEEYADHKHGINPVIGCYEEPHPSAMENMSEEQLMDSLMKCGTIKPCTVGADGKPKPIDHILQLREALPAQQVRNVDEDSD
ncbi:unnamed protein product [Phaedon cochleariae]|uniref:Synembryn n=1 Tax=Phaedon cochleariae TaxID=80249 RepID=A0A9P0DIP1_PHACE|nr:unnamed protein product [Phaedon cochleariae]